MILIESKRDGYKILSENSPKELENLVIDLTELYESKEIFFVNEYTVSKTISVRDFATKNKGYHSSLVICDDETQITSLAQLVRVSA